MDIPTAHFGMQDQETGTPLDAGVENVLVNSIALQEPALQDVLRKLFGSGTY